MDSTTDRKVAEALGWQIFENRAGSIGLARKNGTLRHPFLVESWTGLSVVWEPQTIGRPFRPSEDPADALAALEEYAVQKKKTVKFWFDIGKRTGRLLHVCIITGTVATDGESFQEAACKAILAAEAANG